MRGALGHVAVSGLTGSLAASIGVAILGPEDVGEVTLLARADRAMYQVKRAGGNQVVLDGE